MMIKENSPHSFSLNNSHVKFYSQCNKDNNTFLSNGDRSTLASTKYSTINNYSSTGKFTSNPHQVFEEMIDDMNSNIVNARRKELLSKEREMNQLLESIRELNQLTESAIEEQESTDRQIYILQQENNALMIEYEQFKTANFHSNIELLFLKKRNDNSQHEIDRLNKEIRQLSYMKYVSAKDNENGKSNTKMKGYEIEAIIDQKKILATSIVLLNKKILDIKKNISIHIQKGEMVCASFNNTIITQQGK